jgi:hypothetical protein
MNFWLMNGTISPICWEEDVVLLLNISANAFASHHHYSSFLKSSLALSRGTETQHHCKLYKWTSS